MAGGDGRVDAPGGNHGKLGERGAFLLRECTSNWPKMKVHTLHTQTWKFFQAELQFNFSDFSLNVIIGGASSIQAYASVLSCVDPNHAVQTYWGRIQRGKKPLEKPPENPPETQF